MKSRLPTPKQISQLVAFLPRLYAEGFTPVVRWLGGDIDENRCFTFPWPEYDPVVLEFIKIASRACWNDYEYVPEEAWRMLEDQAFVRTATLAQVRTMLTYCVRGERFCTGHWASMIEQGYIRLLLERLALLQSLTSQQQMSL
jgi:hypothetical protein